MKLYHYSEEPGIEFFNSRFHHVLQDTAVWAISETYRHNYLFSKYCLRICYYATEESSREDLECFIGYSEAKYILYLESPFWDKMIRTILYEYALLVETFQLHNVPAGYYLSKESVAPVSCRKLDRIAAELWKLDVALRIATSLKRLYEEVRKSTPNYSMIRMRNAKTLSGHNK